MSARRLGGLAAFAVFTAAFATRAAQSLGYDELFTVWVSSRPVPDLIRQANADGFTPPLFYVLVKLLATAGLAREDLRILPAFFAGLAAWFGLQASERLFGEASRWAALFVIPGSAYLLTFAHELRPYSALLALGFYCLGRLAGPADEGGDARSAVAAILATALSYLGVGLIGLWILHGRRRQPRSHLALVGFVALILCAPGLLKAGALAGASVDARIVWPLTRPSLSTIFFGLAPMPVDRGLEVAGVLVLAVLLVATLRTRGAPPFGFLARAFALLLASVIVFDTLVPIGFAPRYFALPMAALLLLIVGALSRFARAGTLAALLLLVANGVALHRYLTAQPPPREDWRGTMTGMQRRLGSDGILLAFPFHHAAVAAHAYAPGLRVGGGYTSRSGPVFWYEPPTAFKGYEFKDLERLDDPLATLLRLTSLEDVCILSDEPDVAKTAIVFAAFQKTGETEPFDTGDVRLRASCRRKGPR